MIASAIVLAVLILIALLRFGLTAEYSGDGFSLMLSAGFLKFQILPAKEKSLKQMNKEGKKKEKKERKKKEKARKEPEEEKAGALQTVLRFLPGICKALGRLRRRLLIKRLKIRFIAADGDPYKAAMAFGASSALTGFVTPLIELCFRVRRRDIRTAADFTAVEHSIYINAAISISVWEAIYVAIAVVPALLTLSSKTQNKSNMTKDDHRRNKKGNREPRTSMTT